jgi:chorismate synthase
VQKYARTDVRDILERSSARETAMRVAVGALAKNFLKEFGIQVGSHIVSIEKAALTREASFEEILNCDASPVRCVDQEVEAAMIVAIDEAKSQGSSAGGVFEVVVKGVPVGLGSHAQWDRKLDARLAFGLMSLQAIKGVEVGFGFKSAATYGHELHDSITFEKGKGFSRESNRAGGIEGGISNGEDIVVRAAMKPLSTLIRALKTVDIHSKKEAKASVQRTDTCAVPAAGVVGEAIVAFEIATAFLDKFGGDSISEVRRNYKGFLDSLS